MIAGSLNEWSRDKRYLPPVFERAMSLFLARRESMAKPGHYQLEGEDIYVNVEEGATRPAAERRFEMHRRYIDIQIVLEGRERMDFALQEPQDPPSEDHLEEKDIAFYPEPKAVKSLCLEAGGFAVFLPGELHAPNLAAEAPERHRKAVIKIRASLA